jgi:hypothetical protein
MRFEIGVEMEVGICTDGLNEINSYIYTLVRVTQDHDHSLSHAVYVAHLTNSTCTFIVIALINIEGVDAEDVSRHFVAQAPLVTFDVTSQAGRYVERWKAESERLERWGSGEGARCRGGRKAESKGSCPSVSLDAASPPSS